MVSNARSALARFLPAGGVLLSVLLFGNYAMGQLRDRIFAQTFGAGGELDAYNAAFVLPEILLDVLVASGLSAPFIPIFLQLRGDEPARANRFGQTILTGAVLVMVAVSAVLFVFAPQTTALIAPGFTDDPEQQELYTNLFRVMLITPDHLRRLAEHRRRAAGGAALPDLRHRAAALQRRHHHRHGRLQRRGRDLRRGASAPSSAPCCTSAFGCSACAGPASDQPSGWNQPRRSGSSSG